VACFMLECVSCTARVTLSHEALFATIHADAIIPLPRAPFARLFTAFACERARGPARIYASARERVSADSLSSSVCLRVHRYTGCAMRDTREGIQMHRLGVITRNPTVACTRSSVSTSAVNIRAMALGKTVKNGQR